jgi:hypothetical protein
MGSLTQVTDNLQTASNLQSVLPFYHLDDSLFNLMLYESTHGPVNINANRLETLLFNPIDQAEVSTRNSHLNYLDPDLNFSSHLHPSDYMVEGEINQQVISSAKNITFSLMHLNARSLIGNFDKFKLLLSHLQGPLSVIGVTETWLNDLTSDQVNIPGYNFVSNHRKSKTGGGTGIYLQNCLEYKLHPECSFSDPDVIESLFVEIDVPSGKNIIVGTIYRPPSQNTTAFLDKFNEIMSSISRSKKHCYVMGDFNLDLLRLSDHVPTQEFIDCLFSYAFYPLISNPTRITAHTATLIDNIFTNQISENIFNGIILNDISDHLPIFASFYEEKFPTYQHKIFKRCYNENNMNKFRELLSQIDWYNKLNRMGPDESYTTFVNEYTKLFETCFPLKATTKKQLEKISTPWLTQGLLRSIRKKNKLYKQLIGSPSVLRESRYKKYRNKLTHLIRNAKKSYYDTKFENAKNDLKQTWKLVNEVINKRISKPSTLPSTFIHEGKTITDPLEIADKFCKYFTNIGPSLASKIPSVNSSFRSFLTDNENPPINLSPTNINELETICAGFKSGKAPGYDNIPMHVIKNTFDLISKPLLRLINLSLTTGIFPDKLKIAKVIPIHKSEKHDCFTNYRPISLLTNFSKFFEKIMYYRLIEYIDRYEILYCCQFGFRKNHSTSFALIHLVNKITSAIDRNEITAGVFLDLSKAFDTIDHEILFGKLEHYGICGMALKWIKSYFENRKQFVQFNQTCSSEKVTKCGVPQGSILGPLFFILYINDLPNASELTESLIFADDTSIFYSHSDPNYLESMMNNELKNLDVWMKCNKLSVNIKKTNYIIFKSNRKQVSNNFSLCYDNEMLKQKSTIKFLGVYIDEHLTWKQHISYVSKKISKSVGILHRCRFYLSTKTKVSLYYTLIYPYIIYCNLAWSSTYVTNLNRIFYLQKRAVRIITNTHFRAHSAPLFSQLGLLDIFQINSFHISKFMFRYHKQMLPRVFHHIFVTSNQVHNYNTRSANNYRSHPCRTNLKQFTILYQGPKIWNSLPSCIRDSPSLSTFKKNMIQFLLS